MSEEDDMLAQVSEILNSLRKYYLIRIINIYININFINIY